MFYFINACSNTFKDTDVLLMSVLSHLKTP